MSGELTLFVLRLAFLAVLWIFVFSVIYSLRSDLFGTRATEYQRAMEHSRQQTFAAAKQPEQQPDTPEGLAKSAVAAAAAAAGANAAAGAATSASKPPVSKPVASTVPGTEAAATGTGTTGSAGASGLPYRLVITSGPRRGVEIALGTDPLSIGRAGDSGLVIQDDYTSTKHARLLPSNGGWRVQDLDSTNGTYVNGERITSPTNIGPGTSVRIGTTTFELRQ